MDIQPALPDARQIAFVFNNVANYQDLVATFRSNVEVHVLDATQDGMAQIAAILEGRAGIEGLHIVGHGAQGSLNMGSVTLSSGNIANYEDVLHQIGASLAADGDLLLYGCDIAADTAGQSFLNQLAALTGADVAASSNQTGSALAGGDWVLEQATGQVDSAALAAPDYRGLLASGAVEFTAALPGSTSLVTDGMGGSTDISGITLQISSVMDDPLQKFTAAQLAWTYEHPYGANAIAPGYGNNVEQKSITIKSSDAAVNFSFKSILIADSGGPSTGTEWLKIEGFDNGVSTGFVTVDPTKGNTNYVNTFGAAALTPSIFNNVDEVRISRPDNTDMWIGINNIQIADAVLPLPAVTDAGISITSTGSGTGGAYIIGDTVTAKWNNTSTGDNQAGITGVTMDFSAFGGGTAVTAANDGNGNWTASYQITAGSIDATNRNVSVKATSANGSMTTADTTNLSVDNQAPTVTDAKISISGASGTGGAYRYVDNVTATWDNRSSGDNNSDTIASVKFDFSEFGGGVLDGTNSGGVWSATFAMLLGSVNGATNRNVKVYATDNAGNTTTATDSTNATVDSVAPAITFSNIAFSSDTGKSSSDFITSSASQTITATLSGTKAAGDIVYGSLDNGTSWTDITSKVSGTTLTWDGVTLAGSNTLKLKVTDSAGNNGASASKAYTLDTTAPAQPSTPDMTSGTDSGSSSTDNITSNATPTFTGTAEAGSTVTLYDTDGTTVLGTTTATGGNWTISSSTLSPGGHMVSAKATDTAGNTSGSSSSLAVTIDTAAPTAIGLSATTFGAANATSTSTIAALSATDSQAITYSLATGNGTNDANNGSFTISGTSLKVGGASLTAGTYKIYVAATDAAGNVANQPFTITVADAPSVSSIVRTGGAGSGVSAGATSVQYTVTFDQSVTGVDVSDFTLAATGTADGQVASVSGSGTTWTVTVGNVSGDGTLRLDLNGAGTGIQSGASVAITSGYTSGQTYTLDHTAPSAPSAPDMTTGTDSGTSNSDNITSNHKPTFTGVAEVGSTVTVYDGATVLGTTVAAGGNWSFAPSANLADGSHTISATASDAAGNVSQASAALAVTIDGAAPTIISLNTPPDGTYKEGDVLTFTVGVNEPVYINSGTPTLPLFLSDAGGLRQAHYVSGSGTSTLTFAYTIQAADVDHNGIDLGNLDVSSANVTDAAGNAFDGMLGFAVPTSGIHVDGEPPFVSSVSVPANGTYYIGQNLDFTVNFSENVTVDASSGTPRIALTLDTGGTVYADYVSGSGSTALVFRHTVLTGEFDSTGIALGSLSLQGGAIRDSATNDADLTLDSVGSTAAVLVDGTVPHVTGVSASTANGAYKAGQTVTITVSVDRAVTVDTSGGTPTLALSSGGTATYSGGSGGSTFSFTYVVGDGENSADLDAASTAALSLNGATVKSAGGSHTVADVTLPVPGAAGSLGANKNIVIDTTAPAASLSGLALSNDTGSSSTDFITKTAAQTISATLGTPLSAGDILYGSLDNGATWTDITAKVSGTTLAWNGATLGASGTLKLRLSDAAGNDGASLSQAYVVDTTAPSQTLGNVHISADTGYLSTDFITNSASQTITATLSAALGAGDILYGSTDGGATWTDITAKVSGTTLTWSGATLTGSAILLKVTDVAGNDGALATQSYVLDTVAPAKTGASVSFSSDTGSSATDLVTSTAAQSISGTLTAPLASGEMVYVSLDNGATWTMANAFPGQATWTLPGQVLAGSGTLKVKVSDTAGNDSAQYSHAYVLDTVAPTVTIGSVALSSDTGTSSSDFLTNAAAQTISATLSAALSAGDIVYGSVDNGATWTDITAKVSGTTLAWNGVTLAGSGTLKLRVTDAAGNDGVTLSQAYTVDTTAPALTVSNVHISADTGYSGTDFVTNTASQTITATLSGSLAAGDIVYGSTDGGATWTDVTAKVAGTTLTWDGATLTGNAIKLKVSDAAGNDGAAQTQSYVLDTTAPTTTVASASFIRDTGSSSTDFITLAASQDVTGTLTAPLGNNELVYVSLDNGATWAPADIQPGQSTWWLSDQTLAGSGTLKVKVTDVAGNDGPVYSHDYVLDTTAPSTKVGNLALSTDTGASSSDFVTNAASQTISATLDATLGAGDIVLGTLDNGAHWIDITSKVSGTHITWDGVSLAGSNTIAMLVSDLAGNSGWMASHAFTVDTTPSATVFSNLHISTDSGSSGTDFVTNVAGQTVSATLSAALAAGETVYGSVDGGATWSDITAKVSGTTLQWDGAALAGTSSIKLKITDVAGNDGAVYTQAYVLDTVAPTTAVASASFSSDTGTSATDLVTSSAAQTISGTLSANLAAGETVYVSLDNGATWSAATASGSTWTLAGQTLSGNGTLKVKVSDTAGNDGAVYAHAYELDTTAPTISFSSLALSADTGASSSDFVTRVAGQAISATLSAAPAATDIVYGSLDGGATWTNITAKVTGTSLVWNGATLSGASSIKLKAVDAAGNEGTATTQAYTLDTTAPATTVNSVAFAADHTASGILSANLAAGETVYVSLDNGTTWTAATAAVGQANWTLPGQTLGNTGTVKVKVADTAGNDGPLYSASYAYDTTAPAVAVSGLAPSSDTGLSSTDSLTRLTTPTFTGTAEPDAVVKLYDNAGAILLGSAIANAAGSWSITASAMAACIHDVFATATDDAGNIGRASSVRIEIDTTAPATQTAPSLAAASDSGVVGDNLTNIPSPTITGHGEAFGQISLYDSNGTVLGTAQANASGDWQIVTSVLAGGTHNLTVVETDRAGNVSGRSAALQLLIGAGVVPVAPGAPALTAASDTDARGDGITYASPVIEGTGIASARVELYDGQTLVGSTIADASGHWVIAPAGLQLGAHAVTARQYDVAGNRSEASAAFALRLDAPPPPPNKIDGVDVNVTPVPLPGGQAGTHVDIPIVTPGRVETTGNPNVADIPLVSNAAGDSLLTAQLPIGYGLSATGGASVPAGGAQASLLPAIMGATPGHTPEDQGHLAGNGTGFLDMLSPTQPLLVETVAPVNAGPAAPPGALLLSGSSSPDHDVALVIDATGLAPGSSLQLQNVDFAAVIGSANVAADSSFRVLTGDANSQHFTVIAGGKGAVYAGGGDDTLTWKTPEPQQGSNVRADMAPGLSVTLLHGGTGNDTAAFNGTRDSFTVEFHNGYELVSSKANPIVKALVVNVEQLSFSDGTVAVPTNAGFGIITGLYQSILGRQADLYGFEYWADTHQKYGMSWGTMALKMIDQVEWTSKHEALNGDTRHDVGLLYNALFGRVADGAGLDYWLDVMHQYGVTLEQVASMMLQSDEMVAHQRPPADWNFFV